MAPRDPLTGVLDTLRVRGALAGELHGGSVWGIRVAGSGSAMLHAVTAGSCWIRHARHEPRALAAGDFVLLPAGSPHELASAPTGPARLWDPRTLARTHDEAGPIVLGCGAPGTRIVSASFHHGCDAAHPLLALLPPVLVVPATDAHRGGSMRSTVAVLRRELTEGAAAWGSVVDRLVDVLVIHVIRAWLAGRDHNDASWLGALHDPGVARALTAIHADPAAAWTVASLARETNLSRATLTRRFTALVGEAPLAYLTRWRMDLAAQQLRHTDDPVNAIARRVGYTSEFAFSRAFTRVRGDAPCRYRIAARSGLAAECHLAAGRRGASRERRPSER